VAEQTLGSFRDPEAVREFAKGCDVLTVEIEHIDADAMQVGLQMLASSSALWSSGG
jgi:phosphoribosylaminoimidazole carboxylase (NCAIR synthetase)